LQGVSAQVGCRLSVIGAAFKEFKLSARNERLLNIRFSPRLCAVDRSGRLPMQV